MLRSSVSTFFWSILRMHSTHAQTHSVACRRMKLEVYVNLHRNDISTL